MKKKKHNNRYVIAGTIAIHKNNGERRRYIKTLDLKNGRHGWVPYARYVYGKKHKLIPGSVIHHKDGDTLNDKIGNLIQLSRSEHSTIHKIDLLLSRINSLKKKEKIELIRKIRG